MKHANKTVLVTGGANGIGRGIINRFHSDGANVVIADIDAALGKTAAEELGERSLFVETDVTDEASVDAAIAATVSAFGRLDVSVNNAGIILAAPVIDTTLAQWQRLMDINLNGVFLGSKAAAKQMIDQGGGGSIINASSGAGRSGGPMFSGYSATKAGIIMFSQALALELAPHKIRVNCYAPGHTMTPLWDDIAAGMQKSTGKSRAETVDDAIAEIPWGRMGSPEDVAAVCSWLASEDAEFVVGQTIGINGGMQPWN